MSMNRFTGTGHSTTAARSKEFLADLLPSVIRRPLSAVDESAPAPDEHLVSLLSPHTFEAEQYRSLRLVIEDRHKSTDLQVVAVSSACIGEGKTTTTINLAGALAQSKGARVLLVDGDLRCSAVAARLGLDDKNRAGLAETLGEDEASLASAIEAMPAWNLSVLRAGFCPESPYERLLSPRFDRVIEAMRESYDFIVIDCPPLLTVPDCRLMERSVDGFLLVVSAHQTPKKLLEEALNEIPREKLIGLIFNKDTRPLHGYYGRLSRYYAARRAPSEI